MRVGLLRQLAFSFFILSIVPLLTAGGLIILRTFDREKQHSFENHLEKAENVALHLADHISAVEARMQRLATILSYHVGEVEKQRRYINLLEGSDFGEISLTDREGREIILFSRYRVIGGDDLRPSVDDEAFAQVRSSGETFLGEVYFHPVSREPLMPLAAAIHDPAGGTFEGMLRAEVRLRKSWGLFEQLPTPEGQLVYLVDRYDRIIAHPSSSIVLRHTVSPLLPGTGVARSYRGVEVLYARKDVQMGRQSFGIIVETPAAHALSNAYTTLRVLFVTLLLCLVLSLFLLVHFRRKAVLPLRRLLRAIDKMRAGDLEQRVEIKAEGEIGRVASSFSELTAQLNRELSEHARAEAALRDSEERYRVLFNSGNDAFFVHGFGEDGMPTRFVAVNEVACRRLGYTRQELLGLTPLDIDAPDMRNRMPLTMDEIHRQKRAVFEMVHVAKDGRRIPVEISAHEFTLDNRPHLLNIARDISFRKETEEALRRSRQTFSTILDSQDALVYVTDMDTYEVIFVNQKGRETFGEVDGKLCWETFQAGQTGPCGFCTNAALLDSEGRSTGVHVSEIRNTRNGRWYEHRDRAIDWVDGRTVRISVATDITSRRESDERMRVIFDALPYGIFLVDREKNIRYVNDAALAIFGFSSPDEIVGKKCQKLICPSDRCPILDAGLTLDNSERELVAKDGAHIPILKSVIPITIAGERILLETFLDLREKKGLEDQLRHSQKMEALGTLTGGIAHDFNNLLTAIIGYCELLQEGIGPDSPLTPYVEAVNTSAEKAASLTESLLAFSRKQVSNRRPVDLNRIVRGAESILSRLVSEDIEFTTALSEESLIVMADSGQIDQILMNLVSNARDSLVRGGRIEIRTSAVELGTEGVAAYIGLCAGPYALLSVSDSGVGMSRKTKEKIFEPFFTTKEIGKGTGLGLAVVYGIVKQHGGCIEVESAPGQGTTFKIYLPLVMSPQRPEKTDHQPEAAASPRGEETILVAEDNEQIRNLLKLTLEKAGYRVLLASDGGEALEVFGRQGGEVDLTLLDVIMPRLDGMEVFREIRRIAPLSKVLFMSGYDADVVGDRTGLAGEVDYVSKPISPSELLRKIRDRLDGA